MGDLDILASYAWLSCFHCSSLLFEFLIILLGIFLIMNLQLPTEILLNHVLEAPELQKWFEGSVEAGNPDALLLALKLRENISVDSSIFGKLLPGPYSPSKLFTANHLSSLANCLKVVFVVMFLVASSD